jgi:branched-chain amino acid transport system substrate-binding protein
MTVKRIIAMSLSAVSFVFVSGAAWTAGQYGPGAGDTEIKIGNTMPYSGPASSYGVIGKSEAAYFAMINEQGGIKGRKINFVSRDDSYSPPKTVEQVRKMVEEEGVPFAVPDAWHTVQHRHPGLFKRQQGASIVCGHWR